LIFVCTDEKEEDLSGEVALNPTAKFRLIYSEVEDLAGIPAMSPNVFIPISSITSVSGHRGGIERPSLKMVWNDNKGDRTVVFTEGLVGPRKRNLNDWAPIVEKLKGGTQELISLPRPPSIDSLEGKIVHVLSDMQEKGVFEIEEAVETDYKVDLDPDGVQAACDKLATQHLLIRYPDSSGDVFYRRVSPLGEANLSD